VPSSLNAAWVVALAENLRKDVRNEKSAASLASGGRSARSLGASVPVAWRLPRLVAIMPLFIPASAIADFPRYF
jgi:hypothetical protein